MTRIEQCSKLDRFSTCIDKWTSVAAFVTVLAAMLYGLNIIGWIVVAVLCGITLLGLLIGTLILWRWKVVLGEWKRESEINWQKVKQDSGIHE